MVGNTRADVKIREFLRRLHSPFVGREEEARVVTLTLLSREHAVLIGEPGCVAWDTIVALRDGSLSYIDALYNDFKPGPHKVRIPLHPRSLATEWHSYLAPITIDITTELGLQIRATANHPLLTPGGWVRADALRPGSLVRIAPPAPLSEGNCPRLAAALGALAGGIRLAGAERDYYVFEFKHPGTLTPSETALLKRHGVEFGRGGSLITVNRFSFCMINGLTSLVLERLPGVVLEGGGSVAAFLAGILKHYGSIEVCNDGISLLVNNVISEPIVKALHSALVTYGVMALRRRRNRQWELIVNDMESVARLRRLLRVCGVPCARLLLMFEKMVSIAGDVLNAHPRLPACGGRLYDSVKSVRIIKRLTSVYDLHVPATHSFVSNALISHNTAKSAIVRRAAELLNAKFFKYLLTRFTEPAELFGPLDIRALEEGRYVRLVQGRLPDADIAFLDEIFKANSAILNALNSLLQERVLYDGFTEMRVPLWSLFGASNEVPDDPEVEALYDRFLARHFVRPVPEDCWGELLSRAWSIERRMYYENGLGNGAVMSVRELRALHEKVLNVDLEPVKSKLIKLFAVFESRGVKVTDRRKGKSLKMIAANAVLEGRDSAEERDLIVLKYVIPRDWDELDKVNMILSEELKTPYKYLKELEEIRNNVREVMNYVLSLEGISSRYLESRYRLMLKDLEVAKARVVSIGKECGDQRVRKVVNDVISLIEDAENAINRRIR